MKIHLPLFLLFGVLLNAQIVNFTDATFKAKVLESSPDNKIAKDLNGNYFKIDANNDGEIQLTEAERVSVLNVMNNYSKEYDYTYTKIEDKTGIEKFTNLKEFYVIVAGLFYSELQKMPDYLRFV